MYRRASQGFALPTIVISSVILFAVLVATMGVASSAKTTLDAQIYTALASDAAEAGMLHASTCISDNNNTSTWGSNKLFPNSTCSGAASCAAATSCPLLTSTNYVTSYTVDPVVSANGAQTAKITGTVGLKRTSTGSIWKTYTKVMYVSTGGVVSATQVAFGYRYNGAGAAFFGVLAADGTLRTAGYNADGQLGNGTTSTTLTPTVFNAPTTSPIVAAFTNFLSVGYNMFALSADGNLYGAGANTYGQLGNGTTAATSPTPSRVLLSPGLKARSGTVGYNTNYFITTDNNVYAAGACNYGMLGSNYTVSGCSNQSTPVRVNLPTPDTSDANTIPTDNIVSDRYTTYIRMAGGRVYGWGINDYGQLGNDAFTDIASPVKIGTYGDTSAPKAAQIVYDGQALSVLDDQGKVYSLGLNELGANGSVSVKLRMPGSTQLKMCIAATSATAVSLATCATNSTAQLWQLRSDSTVYNAALNVCLTTTNGTALSMAACGTTTNQKFTYGLSPRGKLTSQYNTSKCITGSGTTLSLAACSTAVTQYIWPYNSTLAQFNIAPAIAEIATDQCSLSVRTTAGEVWSAGVNITGQFGNGTTSTFQFTPVKFTLPTGVTATSIWETSNGSTVTTTQNLMVVGSDGKVYGAGSNAFGQLGDGTTTNRTTPVAMSVIDGTTIIAKNVQVGFGTAVVTTTNGSVYTVGNNSYGQLGDGTTTNRTTPIRARYTNNAATTIY